MTNAAPVIGIFTEGTAVDSFLPTLRQAFQPRALIEFGADLLRSPDFMQTLDLLVLPGISSETSPYHALLDKTAMHAIHTGLDAGMSVWTSCAAAYQFSDSIRYCRSDGKILEKPGVSVFSGRSYGPVDGQSLGIISDDRFSEVRIARIAFNDSAGHPRITGIFYGNGPAYVPAENEPGLEIIAHYADVKDSPVAVAGKPVRNGYVLFSGVLPEIALDHIPLPPDGDGELSKAMKRAARLRYEFTPHEKGRREFMSLIARKFQAKWG